MQFLHYSLHARQTCQPVIGEVMQEAERLVQTGVRELLINSRDTSAYGADIHYRTGFRGGRPVKSNLTGLARALAGPGIWIRLHADTPDIDGTCYMEYRLW